MPPSDPRDPAALFDTQALHRHIERHAHHYDATAEIARMVSQRMFERLTYIRLQPSQIIDLGCGTGHDLAQLAAHYPAACCTGIDISWAMLQQNRQSPPTLIQRFWPSSRPQHQQRLCADASQLPIQSHSISMVWSNLMLHQFAQLDQVLREIQRILMPGGLLMFSTVGPDTLQQLRQAFGDSAAQHVHPFLDMHDIGDALLHNGFSDPVMDMEMLTVKYRNPTHLFKDLKFSGSGNALSQRPRGLLSKQRWQTVMKRLHQQIQEGTLPISLELIQGHAWKTTSDNARSKAASDEQVIHFTQKQR